MRKSCVMCVLMISLLLTGCGGKGNQTPMDRALMLRGTYLSANGYTARMRVTADYGQRVYTRVPLHTAAGMVAVLVQTV